MTALKNRTAMGTSNLLVLVLALLVACPCHALSTLSPSCKTEASLSPRRAFLKQTGFLLVTGAATAAAATTFPTVTNAYGESEPGAKARKKAAEERKKAGASSSTATTTAPRAPSVGGDDLKGALGDFSYGSSSSKSRK